MQQLVYTQNPGLGLAGDVVDLRLTDIVTFIVKESAGIPPGHLVVRDVSVTGSRPGGILPLGQTQDLDAVILSGVSSASPQSISGVGLDGVVGGSAIAVAAAVSMVVSANTDWDATTATLTGIDAQGNQIAEDLNIPNDGAVTLTTTNTYTQVISLDIPAQTGPGGTYTLGYEASSALTRAQILGVAVRDRTGIPSDTPLLTVDTYESVARRGSIVVVTDQAISAGEQAFARVVAGGGSLGTWRGDADSGNAVLVPGARFSRNISATLAVLEVDFVG